MIMRLTYSLENIGKYLHIVLKKQSLETRGVDPMCFFLGLDPPILGAMSG